MGIDIKPRGKSFRARVRKTGYPDRTATFDTEQDARTWADGVWEAITNKDPKAKQANVTFAAWIKRYKEEQADQYTTGADKKGRLSQILLDPIARRLVAEITPDDFDKLKQRLLAAGKRESTVRHYLSDCSAVWQTAQFNWRETELDNPLKLVKRPPPGKGRKVVVPDEARDLIYARLAKHRLPYHRLLAEFLVETAMRVHEPLTLKVENIDPKLQIAHLWGKGGRYRAAPLTKRALEIIEEARVKRRAESKNRLGNYNPAQYPDNVIFPISYRGFKLMWDEARKEAGRPDLWVHDLRRTTATDLIGEDMSISNVKVVTGHTTSRALEDHYQVIQASKVAAILDAKKAAKVQREAAPAPAAAPPQEWVD